MADNLLDAWQALAGQPDPVNTDFAGLQRAKEAADNRLTASKAVDWLKSTLAPASTATYPNTPEAQRAYGRALASPPGKLPPVPGSPVFDPGTGTALDVGSMVLPEIKGLLGAAGGAKLAAGAVPAFIRRASSLPRLGGDAAAREAFEKWVAPHYADDAAFAEHYFAGMHDRDSMGFQSHSEDGEPSLNFEGDLVHPRTGRVVGSIERSVYPADRYASHNSLELRPGVQGHDIGKRLLNNHIEAYQKMGIGRVEMYANVDVGGYAWSKYGFVPDSLDTWRELGKDIDARVAQMSKGKGTLAYGRIGAADRRDVASMLRSSDPRMIWNIADLDAPAGINDARGKPMTLGKALLLGQSWPGKLDMTNDTAMRRFNAYVGK